MDDKFLYQLQEVPDLEFVNNLHKKLGQNTSRPEQRRFINTHNLISSKRLIKVTAFLAISLIAIVVISPARAFVSSLITNIAGLLFEMTEDYPGDNYPGGEEIIHPQLMPLGDALAAFPHEIHLPTNILSGYILNEENVRVYIGEDAGPFANSIEFEWRSADRRTISLRVTDIDLFTGEVVAPDSVEEISLDANHPAVFIRGGWDADHKLWNNDIGFRLRWSVNNLTYDLRGVDREQLVEIAISTLR